MTAHYPDPLRGELGGEGAGQRHDRCIRRRSAADVRERHARRRGGDRQDDAGSPRDHPPRRAPRREEIRLRIGRDGKRELLCREIQKRRPCRQRAGDRDGAEGDVDGPGLLRDGADVLFHRLLVKSIDLRRLGDSAAADDVGRDRFDLAKVASTQKELAPSRANARATAPPTSPPAP